MNRNDWFCLEITQLSFSGFTNNFSDWIDPAIVSFRQFPQFNPQQQQQQVQNQPSNDMYLSQMNQPGNEMAQIFISSPKCTKILWI